MYNVKFRWISFTIFSYFIFCSHVFTLFQGAKVVCAQETDWTTQVPGRGGRSREIPDSLTCSRINELGLSCGMCQHWSNNQRREDLRVGNHWSLVCYVISCHLFWNTSSDPQSSCIWQLLWRDVLWRRHDMWTWVTKQNCGLFFVIQGRCSNIWFFAGVFSYLGVVCVCVFFQVNLQVYSVWACSMSMQYVYVL